MPSASNHARDADTEKIRRVIGEMESRQRPPSGEHALPCRDHESRIIKLEDRSEDHERRLHAGDLGFLDIRKDLQALAKAVNEAVEQMKTASQFDWSTEAKRALINWGVPAGILAAIWALIGSGAVALKAAS